MIKIPVIYRKIYFSVFYIDEVQEHCTGRLNILDQSIVEINDLIVSSFVYFLD